MLRRVHARVQLQDRIRELRRGSGWAGEAAAVGAAGGLASRSAWRVRDTRVTAVAAW